jgi:hypothetical protein
MVRVFPYRSIWPEPTVTSPNKDYSSPMRFRPYRAKEDDLGVVQTAGLGDRAYDLEKL